MQSGLSSCLTVAGLQLVALKLVRVQLQVLLRLALWLAPSCGGAPAAAIAS